MPIPLSFTLAGYDSHEAKRSLKNFIEMINQNRLQFPDDIKEQVGTLVKQFNDQHITLREFKTEINDIYQQLTETKNVDNASHPAL